MEPDRRRELEDENPEICRARERGEQMFPQVNRRRTWIPCPTHGGEVCHFYPNSRKHYRMKQGPRAGKPAGGRKKMAKTRVAERLAQEEQHKVALLDDLLDKYGLDHILNKAEE
jgi:hypothetical protein